MRTINYPNNNNNNNNNKGKPYNNPQQYIKYQSSPQTTKFII
jgi:hypothetical protein